MVPPPTLISAGGKRTAKASPVKSPVVLKGLETPVALPSYGALQSPMTKIIRSQNTAKTLVQVDSSANHTLTTPELCIPTAAASQLNERIAQSLSPFQTLKGGRGTLGKSGTTRPRTKLAPFVDPRDSFDKSFTKKSEARPSSCFSSRGRQDLWSTKSRAPPVGWITARETLVTRQTPTPDISKLRPLATPIVKELETATPSPTSTASQGLPPRSPTPTACFRAPGRENPPHSRAMPVMNDLTYDIESGEKLIGPRASIVDFEAVTSERNTDMATPGHMVPGVYSPLPTESMQGGGGLFSPQTLKTVRTRSAAGVRSVKVDEAAPLHHIVQASARTRSPSPFGGISRSKFTESETHEIHPDRGLVVDPAPPKPPPTPSFNKMTGHSVMPKGAAQTEQFTESVRASAVDALDKKLLSATRRMPVVDIGAMPARKSMEVKPAGVDYDYDERKAYAFVNKSPPAAVSIGRASRDRAFNRHEAVKSPVSVSTAYISRGENYLWARFATPC